jgi:hypothetical protein
MTQQCQECSRRDSEIQRLRSAATTLRQAKLQDEEPLPDDPAEWLQGFESDQAITDQLRAIGQEVARLQREQVQHATQDHKPD